MRTLSDRIGILEAFDRTGNVSGLEMRVKKRDGTPLWIRSDGRAVRGVDGRGGTLRGLRRRHPGSARRGGGAQGVRGAVPRPDGARSGRDLRQRRERCRAGGERRGGAPRGSDAGRDRGPELPRDVAGGRPRAGPRRVPGDPGARPQPGAAGGPDPADGTERSFPQKSRRRSSKSVENHSSSDSFGTFPSEMRWRSNSVWLRRWRRSASSRAGSPTTSTTCSP